MIRNELRMSNLKQHSKVNDRTKFKNQNGRFQSSVSISKVHIYEFS